LSVALEQFQKLAQRRTAMAFTLHRQGLVTEILSPNGV